MDCYPTLRLYTGDIGYYDSGENLFLVDRLKELIKVLFFGKTQFQIEGGGLVQGVTKLITILSTFVTLNKNYANWLDNKFSWFIIFRKCMVFQKKEKKIKYPKKKEPFFMIKKKI